MAQTTARPDPDLPQKARFDAAFAEAEREGLMLAALVRIAALCAIILWRIIDDPAEGMDLWSDVVQIGAFAVLGVAQYLSARHRFHMNVLKYVFVALDCALLAIIMTAPDPFEDYVIPPAILLHSPQFLYFYLPLMQAAFSFRPALMLWCGACIVVARTGMLLWLLEQPGVFTNLDLTNRSIESVIAARDDPNFLFLGFWATEMLMSLILAGGLAMLVRRSRQLVERRALAERARASLARYFSPNVVDRLSGSADALAIPREQKVAVLFADIMGFTTLCERAEPDEVVALLRGYHDRLGQAVFDHGGTLDKYIGDGLMATFGTPDPAPDDAARALRCALAMIAALEDWNRERGATGLAPVRVGVGLHYGAVVAGDIGNARRLEYGVIGDTVNIASRLEHLTRGLGSPLVVSAPLIEALPEADAGLRARFKDGGPQEVRGRASGVRVWYLSSAG